MHQYQLSGYDQRNIRKAAMEQRDARSIGVTAFAFASTVFPVLMLLLFLAAIVWPDAISLKGMSGTPTTTMGVDTTTFLEDAKMIYGTLVNQVGQQAILINLFGDGSKFSKPISEIGVKGYTFLARLAPNYNMGYRKEGVGGVGAAGNQGLKQATVYLKYAYVPVMITGQAENLTKGQTRAFMQAKALEAKFDMLDITSHVNVVIAGAERGGQLAQCSATVGAGSTTCSTAGGLPGALYLRVGMPIDIGPVGGGANHITGATITAINYSTGAITFSGGLTPTSGDAIYLSGEAPLTTGDFPMTAECMAALVSDSGLCEGLNPATSGQTAWQSYLENINTNVISAQSMMRLAQFVKNRGGVNPDMYITSPAQINQYVGIATAVLKYDVTAPGAGVGKKAIDLGFAVFSFGTRPLVEDKDIRNDVLWCGSGEAMKKFEAIPLSMAEDEAGTWTRVSGTNGIADAVQGLLRWYHQIGITQRSAWGKQYGYTVPTQFSTAPQTLV